MFLWLIVIYMFAEALFFGTKSIFVDVASEGASNFGYFSMILYFLIGVFFIIKLAGFINEKDKSFQYSKVIIVFIVLALSAFIFIGALQYNGHYFIVQQGKYFLSFVFPSVILGMMITEKNILELAGRMKIISIYLTLSLSVALIGSVGQGFTMFHDLAGATHLTIGYAMSAMFGINLLSFFYQRTMSSKLLFLALMIINVAIILFSGSRGSLVSVVLMLALSFLIYMIWKKKFIIGVILLTVIGTIVPVLFTNANFSFAIERILAGFSSSGDESTSQRLVLYDTALNNFYENPIFGKGIGSFSNEIGRYYYPHNIFLEVLNDFGMIGFFVLLFFLVMLLRKSIWIIKQKSYQDHMLVFLFLNVFVQLIFSGSYLADEQFWLLGTIIFCFNRKKYKEAELEISNKEQKRRPFLRKKRLNKRSMEYI